MARYGLLRLLSIFTLGIVGLALLGHRPGNAQASLLPLSPYEQDFNTLVASGTGTTANLPTGWTFVEIGSNANITYTAGTGSSNTGDTYSFGAANSTERAFGELSSGSLVSILGVQFQNQTSGTIGQLIIQYYCEQWRRGDSPNDVFNFQYSTDATSLTTGTWTDVDALDCLPTTTTGSQGALDGNANRTLRSATILGLSIPPNGTIWLRWAAVDASGFDHGLAVDDFQLNKQTPTAVRLTRLTATAAPRLSPWEPLGMSGLALLVGYGCRRVSGKTKGKRP
jgi:hypothetical protein